MSKYKPAKQIDTPADQLNRALKRADQESRRQLSEWMKMIDVFWCAPVTHGENAQTKEQLQAKIDADPAKTQLMLTGSKNFIAFHLQEDADLVNEMVPARYLLDGAYTWGDGLTLNELRPEWDVQPEV